MEFSTSSDMVICGWVQSSPLHWWHKPSPATECSSCTFHHRQGRSPTTSSLLNLHCCRGPICCSTLLRHHLLVPFVHLPLNVLQAYSISITQNFIGIVDPKSLFQLLTFPNKAQGFDIVVCLLCMCSSHANTFYCCLLMMFAFEMLTKKGYYDESDVVLLVKSFCMRKKKEIQPFERFVSQLPHTQRYVRK